MLKLVLIFFHECYEDRIAVYAFLLCTEVSSLIYNFFFFIYPQRYRYIVRVYPNTSVFLTYNYEYLVYACPLFWCILIRWIPCIDVWRWQDFCSSYVFAHIVCMWETIISETSYSVNASVKNCSSISFFFFLQKLLQCFMSCK